MKFFLFESYSWSSNFRLFGDCITSIKLLTEFGVFARSEFWWFGAGVWQTFGKCYRLFFPQQILGVSFHKIWLQHWSQLLPCPYASLCHLFVVSVKPFVKLCCKQDHWNEQVGWELSTALLSKLPSCETTPFGCAFMIQHVWWLYHVKLFLPLCCVLKLLLYEYCSGTFHLGRWAPTWPSLTWWAGAGHWVEGSSGLVWFCLMHMGQKFSEGGHSTKVWVKGG